MADLDADRADVITVGTAALANPDLPARLRAGGDHHRYADYPALEVALTGSPLLRLLIDGPVRIDPDTRTARVPAGGTWGDVLHRRRHRVLLGGGLSFYGRRFGLAANSVRSLTVVLADGEVVETSATNRPDLLWALRGGGGGIGVVVAAEIDLVPMHSVVTGMAVWDPADAARLAPVWQEWARTAPPQISTSFRMLSLPPLPSLPPYLAGRRVLALDGAVVAPSAADVPAAQHIVDTMLSPLTALARPVANTWVPAPPQALPLTHLDPPQPVPFQSDSALLHEIDEPGWARILNAGSGLLALEPRQLGGAFAAPPTGGGALDRFTAPLLYYAVGLAGDATVRDLKAVRSAVEPFLTGFTAPNFVEHFDQPQRTLDDHTRIRVERIRHGADPTGLFAGDIDAIRLPHGSPA